jgi:DNA-binding transcriptional MerR regulator
LRDVPEDAGMKMRDLVKQTGVARETIHFYVREGMLPRFEKTSPNQAVYTEEHVERILLIKKLQDRHFLPIPLIKKILEHMEETGFDPELLEIKSDYFTSADHLMPEQITGEAAFLDYTGMSANRLADFESYGIITPDRKGRQKVYPHDSIKLGKLIGDMRRRGLSHENGFRREGLKELRDMLLPVVGRAVELFQEGLEGNDFSEDEVKRLAHTALELMPLFMYHTSHILHKKAVEELFDGRRSLSKST